MLLKTKIYIGVGILVMAMGAAIFLLTKQNKRLRLEKNQAISFDLARQDTIKIIRNENGKLSARIEVEDLTNRNLRALREDDRLFWITQLDIVNKRMNNVEQVSRTTARVVGNFKIPLRDTTIFVNDSLPQRVRTFDNHDKWLRVSGIITPDTIEVVPFVNIEIKTVIVWQRKHKLLGIRFGKKQYFGESVTENPYATITNMEITRIGRKRD